MERKRALNADGSPSSNLFSYGYDSTTQILEVEFQSNRAVYQYADVPQAIYRELDTAQSKGQYFIRNIRDVYAFRKAGSR